MTELHIWIYTGLAVAILTVGLFVWAYKSSEDNPIDHGMSEMIALSPLFLFIIATAIRVVIGFVVWLLAPLFGG